MTSTKSRCVPDYSAWIFAKSTIALILVSSWFGRILFWVVVVGMALEVAMRLTGWIIFLPTQDLNREANLNAKIRILAIGESTTADHFASARPGAWPRQLQSKLQSEGYDVSVFNLATGGITSSILLSRLEKQLLTYRPHLVIAMMGVNDHRYSQYIHESGLRGWFYRLHIARGLQLSWRAYLENQFPQVIPEDISNFGRWWSSDMEPHFIRAVVTDKIKLNGVDWVEKEASQRAPCSQSAILASIGAYYWGETKVEILPENLVGYFRRAFEVCPQSSLAQYWYLLALENSENHGRCREVSSEILKFGINLEDQVFEHLVACWLPNYPKELVKIADLKSIKLVDGDLDISNPNYGGAASYLELYNILRGRGIALVAMQYPTLDIDEIKKPFRNLGLGEIPQMLPDKSLYFVENRYNFLEALRNQPYEEIFTDRFRKTWGHLTPFGHELIADQLVKLLHPILNEKAVKTVRPQ